MRIAPIITALCLTPMLVQAAIPEHIDQTFARYTALPEELHPVLASVTDKESADQATEALNALLPKIYDLRTELRAISELPTDVRTELLRKYETPMRRNWGKVYEEIFRLQTARCYDSLSFFKQFHALCMMLNK